ncbi:hypothetical protein SAMN04487846_3456 [Microbacterium sp. cf046]|uniref:hypothetical protein n=1 Tax=Microbacterium sp. cf046 TaxID=1761803 RepID=UPI0008F313B4|nr:hypothetical protein [Microbacterium sp. cf046]SFS17122.1 hypothetical protein SAMN04487846_3456 [Microbacterium sp. cf046]
MSFIGDVWDGVKGAASGLWSFAKGAFWHLVGGVLELPTFIGIMPAKKLRLSVKILIQRDPNTNGLSLVAARDDVETAVQTAVDIYWAEAKIRMVGAGGGPIVTVVPEPAPEYVLFPPCGDKSDFVTSQFNEVGAWFRDHRVENIGGALAGIGSPITVFIVNTVGGHGGCAVAGFFGSYAYVGKDWMTRNNQADADGVTLAHEIGHVLDLSLTSHFPSKDNVMNSDSQVPPRSKFVAYQQYWIRGSQHVTYMWPW